MIECNQKINLPSILVSGNQNKTRIVDNGNWLLLSKINFPSSILNNPS